ncbi:predicted protein [Uncinocarpus reesii 1704]|uniref:Phytocyanin domain-containing protein n=1 Tax=Uncinocarpus reesii (strain UAMH 1704) TaxID=336963 RepID=C4JKR0_UNCRE|nr:uncharacterized protein UREG_00658 [Uncinocarpus reesii 1704]EEP75811.1 predicted protein [Uncinocarpus reesii 1704]
MPSSIYYLCSLALAGTLASARTITVMVAQGGLNFTPGTIRAQTGDEVAFVFTRGNHDVTLGEFDRPCQPAPNAFWSGTITIPSGLNGNATFTIPIRDTEPKWIYCSFGRHCQNGMVGVINPPSEGDNTFDAYKSAAEEAPESNRPTAINGGSLIVRGDLEIPGFPGNSESSSTGAPTGSATNSATASGTPPATQTGNAGATIQTSGALGAVMAGLTVGAAWFGLI